MLGFILNSSRTRTGICDCKCKLLLLLTFLVVIMVRYSCDFSMISPQYSIVWGVQCLTSDIFVVICTRVTLFCTVLTKNALLFSQSELSNFFKCIINYITFSFIFKAA